MNNSWQDKLGALLSSMPQAEEEIQETAAAEAAPEKAAQKERLDIIYERKGRAGKPATIIVGFTIDDDAVADIASRIKRSLGTGGSARGGEILVQGDRRKEVLAFLTKEGFKARII